MCFKGFALVTNHVRKIQELVTQLQIVQLNDCCGRSGPTGLDLEDDDLQSHHIVPGNLNGKWNILDM